MPRIKIGKKIINVLLSIEKNEREEGMMGKVFPDYVSGMLFVSKKQNQSFWMKNCLIPLDILFIDNHRITKICKNCEPCKVEPCRTYNGFGNLVLELNAGFCEKEGINEGDTIKILR